MSLINKMLQDLDARGGAQNASAPGALASGETASGSNGSNGSNGAAAIAPGAAASRGAAMGVRAVSGAESSRRVLVLAAVVAGVLAAGAAGWFGWQYSQQRRAVPPAAPPSVKIVPATPPTSAHADMERPPVAAAKGAPGGGSGKSLSNDGAGKAGAADRTGNQARVVPGPAARSGAGASAGKHAASAASEPVEANVSRELGPAQLAESAYRRALLALQEGRVSEALAGLERALEIDPRHEAARQTIISLLLENRRPDEAIRHLRMALGLDVRQPALAMVLARLQLERGGAALETLQRTLPYATNNAEYQGFLAGVLQREQRNAEAAEHYQAALKIAPQNSVWWMGLGISLQAEKHLPEAREAFSRAKAGGGLTPELQGFVERRIEVLGR